MGRRRSSSLPPARRSASPRMRCARPLRKGARCALCPCRARAPSTVRTRRTRTACCRRRWNAASPSRRERPCRGGNMSGSRARSWVSIISARPPRRRTCSRASASRPSMCNRRSTRHSRRDFRHQVQASKIEGREPMAIKVGINGYGRIGRNILRALYEAKRSSEIQIVAINDLGDANTNAHLTRYDTAHGRFEGDIRVDGDSMIVNGDRIRVVAQRDPTKLPWGELGVDFVLECTGLFTSKAKAAAHLTAGAKKVVISAPGGEDVDATIVYGVNDKILKATDTVISNASCTTNCLAPLVKVLHENIGVLQGVMNTIHSYTNDQVLTDVYHTDLRRARSATMSMIPTKTGAAAAVGLVLPELKGKIDGFAIRVPTINVSLVDLSFTAARKTSVDEINKLVKTAATGPLQGILAYNDQPLVSVDFNHDPHSSIYDATLTKVIEGTLVKVCSWYDNEWGFSNRMLDTVSAWSKVK